MESWRRQPNPFSASPGFFLRNRQLLSVPQNWLPPGPAPLLKAALDKTSCSNLSVRATLEVFSFGFRETLLSSVEYERGSTLHPPTCLPASSQLLCPPGTQRSCWWCWDRSCTKLRRAGFDGHHTLQPPTACVVCLPLGLPPQAQKLQKGWWWSMVILFEHCGCWKKEEEGERKELGNGVEREKWWKERRRNREIRKEGRMEKSRAATAGFGN